MSGSRWTAADVKRVTAQVSGALQAAKPSKAPKVKAQGFDPFLELLKARHLPAPELEGEFIEGRKFRADYIWRARKVIVERNGGIFRGGKSVQGGHSAGKGILRDMEKSNLAQLAGFTYLQFTPQQLERGDCVDTLKILLECSR